MIEKLHWDSEFFEIPIGRLLVQNIEDLKSADFDNYRLVYLIVDPSNKMLVQDLKKTNIPLVDEKLTFVKKVTSDVAKPANVASYHSSVLDNAVIKIGLQSSIFSRFRIDPNFPKGAYEKLYSAWMQNSISRTIAKEVFIYNQKNGPEGVITIGEKNGRADIGIIAIDENSRGKSIGSTLIHMSEYYASKNQYNELQVVTQKANMGACNFYLKNGFRLDSYVNIYHIWNNQ